MTSIKVVWIVNISPQEGLAVLTRPRLTAVFAFSMYIILALVIKLDFVLTAGTTLVAPYPFATVVSWHLAPRRVRRYAIGSWLQPLIIVSYGPSHAIVVTRPLMTP
jgi:hypothetical protein